MLFLLGMLCNCLNLIVLMEILGGLPCLSMPGYGVPCDFCVLVCVLSSGVSHTNVIFTGYVM